MNYTSDHPLSVYFKNPDNRSNNSGSNSNGTKSPIVDLSKSSERGAKFNLHEEARAGSGGHSRSKVSAGTMPSVFGSIETSPNNNATGRSYKSNGDSSSKGLSNPADNYQFLGGIREVDDDQESMSGTIGSNNKPRAV